MEEASFRGMAGQVAVRNGGCAGFLRREQLLAADSPSPPPARRRVAEVAGGTAAECAAVCCCCPCGLVNLLLVAVVKLPAGLCRRAINRRRRRLRAKRAVGALPARRGWEDELELQILPAAEDDAAGMWSPEKSPSVIISAMEMEMPDRFFTTGFWRIPSQREQPEDGHGHGHGLSFRQEHEPKNMNQLPPKSEEAL